MSDEGDSAPPAKKSDAPPARRQPREKTCYNCGEVSTFNAYLLIAKDY